MPAPAGACSRSIPRSRSGGSTARARSIEPKKVKGRCYEPGLALRRRLLIDAGFAGGGRRSLPPKGAGPDDLLDALACAAIARRIHAGVAQPFPDPPERDAFGLPMAIWA